MIDFTDIGQPYLIVYLSLEKLQLKSDKGSKNQVKVNESS